MDDKYTIKIPVRELVEFVLHSGNLGSEYAGGNKAVEGTRTHRLIQKSRPEEYEAEVPVSHVFEEEGLSIDISGRIDGIYKYEDGIIIDEIKSTSLPLEDVAEDYNQLHWAQAKCYGYLYALQNNINVLRVQLTYVNRDTKMDKFFIREFTIEELRDFFFEIYNKYYDWIKRVYAWNKERNASIKELQFPFPQYRKGQRDFAVAAYKTIINGNRLFAQAPTGIGKTIATLFPAVKAVGEGQVSKIFYLTARTIARTVAENAVENLRGRGLKFKTLTLTAKEKICFCQGECRLEECPYALGYFDRINAAVEDIYSRDNYNAAVIQEYALKHNVCPFEFSLDIALWADCIICDYNYVFDPRVYLKRFFTSGGEYVFLVDEAHNLVDRSREMFSAELSKKPFLKIRKKTGKELKGLYSSINNINSYFIKLRKRSEEEGKTQIIKEPLKDLYKLVETFMQECEVYFERGRKLDFHDELLEIYFNALGFIRISEFYDERYVTYIEKLHDDIRVRLYCLDPSFLLQNALKRGKTAVFFSATLMPVDYFSYMLGGYKEDLKIKIHSPFPDSNLCLLLADNVSTKYRQREQSYNDIAELIHEMSSAKRGNYIAYFPSYKYMGEVLERFTHKDREIDTIVQKTDMSEQEREEFLKRFSPDNQRTLVGFAVMGGMFGEGIDLVGERLSGVAIVGVGLPQVCPERDIIREHFEEKIGMGFEYAYVYPGMNKVLQAAGRVIRTEKDRGVVLLIDERFSNHGYRRLFPAEWKDIKRVRNLKSLREKIISFWNE